MKIVFIGDSITCSYGVLKEKAFLTNVEDKIDDKVVNKGVNGQGTEAIKNRFKVDVIDEKPKLVHIMGGVNDFIGEKTVDFAMENIKSMVNMAFESKIKVIIGISPKIVVDSLPFLWKIQTNFAIVEEKTIELRNKLIEFCKSEGIEYIDYFQLLDSKDYKKENKSLYIDGLHLSEYGNLVLSEIFLDKYENIKKAYGFED